MYDQAMPPSRRLNQKDETQNTYIHTYDSKNTIKVKQPGPEVINHCSCSTQLSMKFILLINVKMPTIVGILIFMSIKNTTSEHRKAFFLNV